MTTQPESKLSRAIMDALRRRGAFVSKTHGGPMTMNGLPDIQGCFRGRYIGVETKTPIGKDPSPVQRLRADQIRDSGGHVLCPCRSVAEATAWLAALDAEIDADGSTPPIHTPTHPTTG